MKILINLAGITKHDSQEIYAVSILEALLPKLKGDRVYVVSSKIFPQEVFGDSQIKVLKIGCLINKLFSVFFTQVLLPVYTVFLGIDTLYSPAMSFPVIQAGIAIPTLHDLDYLSDDATGNSFARIYMRLLYKKAAKQSKKTFVISEAVAKEASQKYSVPLGHFVVVHNALPHAAPTQHEDLAGMVPLPFFLYIGMYKPRKNIEFLITAFAKVCDTIPESLVLAGSVKTHEKELLQLAQALGCQQRVIFTGYVSDASKESLYKSATAVVLPSLYEGFGFPILEANHYKAPVVLSDIPVFHEVAGDAAVFVDPTDVTSLADTLTTISSNVSLRDTLKEKGIKNLERFSWEASAQTVASIITRQ